MSKIDESSLSNAYHRKRFLIVDDFENIRIALKKMMVSFGAEKVDTASSGNTAINACKKYEYDVILCDYNLGSGKNGQQILEELRHLKRLKHTDIFVIISAESSKEMVMAAVESQPDGYVAKPYTQTSIKNRLDKIVQQKESLSAINRALDEEQYASAIAHCSQEIQKKSKYQSWCIQTMANLHYLEGNYDEARKIYTGALAKRELTWAHLGIAKIELAEHDFEAAEASCQKILVNTPHDLAIYELLTEIYVQQGEHKKAQQSLEVAVAISPLNILRQKKLGEVCVENQDIERAADAYRKTVNLGEYSCYGSIDDHLEFSRCLTDLCDGDTSLHGQALFDEAINELRNVKKKYGESEDVRIQSLLIETRALSGQNHKKEAMDTLEEAKALCKSKENSLSVDCGLELAKSLHSVDQDEEAKQLLSKLAADHQEDKRIQGAITDMQEDSLSYREKTRARNLNKKGIRLAERGELPAAIASFKLALVETPKHPGLNLNLVQTIMEQFQQMRPDEESISICQSCIERIRHIPEGHKQYKRFVQMAKLVDGLTIIQPIPNTNNSSKVSRRLQR